LNELIMENCVIYCWPK